MAHLPERIQRRLTADFPDPDAAEIAADEVVGVSTSERIQAALILCADGNLARLHEAAALARADWRDVLVRSGLADDDWPERIEAEFGTSNEWEMSDAWFATAIAWCGSRNPDLTEVIAAGDALNHDIINRGQIQQAVRRLQGAGFLQVRDGGFKLTRRGRSLIRKRVGRGAEQVRSVLTLLSPLPLTATGWTISPAEVDQAYRRYRNKH